MDKTKKDWKKSVIEIERVHNLHIVKYGKYVNNGRAGKKQGWSERDTARLLNLSVYTVTTSLLIAKYMKILPMYLNRCTSKKEALTYIKSIKGGL